MPFLSCLSGSDAAIAGSLGFNKFLSCLSGSDVSCLRLLLASSFLSCLSGSDVPEGACTAIKFVSELPIRQ